jgi:hypothetical protein
MASACNHVYVHFAWVTWDRAALVTPEREAAIYACIRSRFGLPKLALEATGSV